MIELPLCPRCGAHGDVEVSGAHDVRCNLCGGAFTPLAQALPGLAGAGVAEAQLVELFEREGRRDRPCPGCGDTLTTFPLAGEQMHVCARGQVLWMNAGALERLAQPAEPAPAAPPPPEPPAPVTAQARPPAPRAADPAPAPEFRPAVKPLSDTPQGLTLGALAGRVVVLGLAAAFIFLVVRGLSDRDVPAEVGGGATATFFRAPLERSQVHFETPALGTGERTRARRDGGVEEVTYVPRGGGRAAALVESGTPSLVLTVLGHRPFRFVGMPLEDGSFWGIDAEVNGPQGSGSCRYSFDDSDAWVACAYGTSPTFAESGAARRFLASVRR